MRTMKSIFYEAQKNRIANPIWGWENILEDWEKILGEWYNRGPMYNGIPEVEKEPVHIDTKTIYVYEEPKRGCLVTQFLAKNRMYDQICLYEGMYYTLLQLERKFVKDGIQHPLEEAYKYVL